MTNDFPKTEPERTTGVESSLKAYDIGLSNKPDYVNVRLWDTSGILYYSTLTTV